MAKLWLSLMLVGPTAAFLLTVPKPSISIPAGNTTWLSALLSVPASLPHYFQLRWYFVTAPQLVLMLLADNCKANGANQHWRDCCKIRIEKTEGYKHRAELSSTDASLVLRDVRVEDSGIYSITLLALGVKLSANINLTVTNGDNTSNHQTESSSRRPVLTFSLRDDTSDLQTESSSRRPVLTFPLREELQEEKYDDGDGDDDDGASVFSEVDREVLVSSVKAADDRDYTVPNIIHLSLAGLIFCVLALIIAENISFTYRMEKQASATDGREVLFYPNRMEATFPPVPGNSSLFVKLPGSDEFCSFIDC